MGYQGVCDWREARISHVYCCYYEGNETIVGSSEIRCQFISTMFQDHLNFTVNAMMPDPVERLTGLASPELCDCKLSKPNMSNSSHRRSGSCFIVSTCRFRLVTSLYMIIDIQAGKCISRIHPHIQTVTGHRSTQGSL